MSENLTQSKVLLVEGIGVLANNVDLVKKELAKGSSVMLVPTINETDFTPLQHFINVSLMDSVKMQLEVNTSQSYFNGVLLNATDKIVKPWFYSQLNPKESLYYILQNHNASNGVGMKEVGAGKLALIPFPLSDGCTNLHHHAFFVPLMYEFAFHASSGNAPLYHRAGEKMLVLPSKKDVIELIADNEVFLAEKMNELYQLDAELKTGVYALNTDQKEKVLAINSNLRESNPQFLSLEDLQQLNNVSVLDVENEIKLQQYFKNLDLGFALWKYCLILSVLFLIIEIVLIRLLR